MASEHASEWRAAMTKETGMLTKFKCFNIVTQREALQHGKLAKSKWAFKVKYQQDGTVERFKAKKNPTRALSSRDTDASK